MTRLILVCLLATFAFSATADPPESSGIVWREGVAIAWIFRDFDSGLSVVLGTDPVELCNGTLDFDIVYYSDKYLPPLRLSTLGKGELTTTVWDYTGQFDCDYFLSGVLPLATGLSKYRSVDNDLFILHDCQLNNMNPVSRAAHGTLYSPYGEKNQFQFILHEVYDCDTDTSTLLVNRISLR